MTRQVVSNTVTCPASDDIKVLDRAFLPTETNLKRSRRSFLPNLDITTKVRTCEVAYRDTQPGRFLYPKYPSSHIANKNPSHPWSVLSVSIRLELPQRLSGFALALMAPLSSPQSKSPKNPPGCTHKRSRHQLNSARSPGPLRMQLSTPKHNFELLASRTLSQAASEDTRNPRFPASPLDSIDPSLYPHFPRFSVTTDNSLPDLSTDEVTSTRISLDEECIVASDDSGTTGQEKVSRRKKLQAKFQNAVSSPSLDMKRVGDHIKRVPSFLRSKPPRLLRRSISDSQAEVFEHCIFIHLIDLFAA